MAKKYPLYVHAKNTWWNEVFFFIIFLIFTLGIVYGTIESFLALFMTKIEKLDPEVGVPIALVGKGCMGITMLLLVPLLWYLWYRFIKSDMSNSID